MLRKMELLEVGKAFGLDVAQRMTVDELVDVVAASKRATLDEILGMLSLATLKAICDELGLATDGREKRVLAERITEVTGRESKGAPVATEPDRAADSEPGRPAAKGGKGKAPPAKQQAWLNFPTLGPVPLPEPPPAAPQRSLVGDDGEVTVWVEPRKPKLAWHGWWRKEVAVPVPTQVVEIVHPGRAIHRDDELIAEARQQASRDATTVPPNRLIWTNDNLVALTTLLEERDPATRDYRYRGKVDLVYIDPPFMVNSDFRADNTIDIDIDEAAGVTAHKEPSLVEILAYRDTWRQGLDTFLSMLRTRLHLLRELLASSGSIYVHLDWHAAHYVKVLLDEIFGYDCFRSEVIWKRASARAGSQSINNIHDTILCYGRGAASYHSSVRLPQDPGYVRSHYGNSDEKGRYRLVPLNAPGESKGPTGKPWRGYMPPSGRHWSNVPEELDRLASLGLIRFPTKGKNPELKQYLDETDGIEVQSLWTDIAPVNAQAIERIGYPTQKPLELVDRIIRASCPPGGLVLDCFMGSGTTCEAAELLGRRWIGIDNGKYAVHVARKRLIQLHGQPRPPDKVEHDYVECDHCGNIERKERKAKEKPAPFLVQPFTVENMGVYQRAEKWQDFQTERSRYRDEMIKVFGGEPVAYSPLLHGKKGNQWVHVGPLDGPISGAHVWNIAREAQHTTTKAVTILAADFDTLSTSQKDDILRKTGVTVTIRIIPASAIDEIKKRIETARLNPDVPYESMAIPAFYAPLSIRLTPSVTGRRVRLTLERCEIDVQSFLDSQRPASLKKVTEGMTAAQKKKVQAEQERWDARKDELDKWLAKATTWQKFIDFWAVDWDHGSRVGPDGKPIFETDWQSFRERRGKEIAPLSFTADLEYTQPGRYRVAARVTDVFGNDGIASVEIEVK